MRHIEDRRLPIEVQGRSSPDNQAFICDVLEKELDANLKNPDLIKKDWEISTIEFEGKKLNCLKLKTGTDTFTGMQMVYGDAKAKTALDEQGNVYYFDKSTGKYILDSRIDDINKYKQIFETLKAKE